MARKPQSMSVSNSLEYTVSAPADARLVVETKDDLYDAASYPFSYVGMLVSVQSVGKAFLLKAKPSTDPNNWVELGADIDTSAIETEIGKKAEGYIETATETISAGDDKVLVENQIVTIKSADGTKTYQGVVDDTGKAVIDVEGKSVTVEHDGTGLVISNPDAAEIDDASVDVTTETIHKIDARLLPKGQAVDTQDYMQSALTVKVDSAGKYKKGDVIPVDTPLEEVVRNLLLKTNNPTVAEPTATITGTGDKLLETGASINATLTVNFNRGAVSPVYNGVSYRAGEATAYSINGGGEQAENTFDVVVNETNREFTATVKYGAGQDIMNDEGEKYMDALAAGSVTTSALTYNFVDAIYSNQANINVVAKEALVAKSVGEKVFNFPAAVGGVVEEFHIPADWSVIAVEVENELSGRFEPVSEFDVTDVVHPNAANVDVAFKCYKDGRGFDSGPRKVRVRWTA